MTQLLSFFRLKENNTTTATEIRAGLTTFLAMAYIIFLNPVFLSETGMDSQGVLIATCLSAAIGSLLCAFVSNKPFAMASGMGMNAFFTYTLVFGYGYTWQQALALTFISGLCFFLLVLILGNRVAELIPTNLKHAITVGIGLFILEIGLLDAGLITMTAGFPALGDLSQPSVLIPLVGLFVTLILMVCGVRGSLILGILFTTALSLIMGQTQVPSNIFEAPTALSQVALKLDFGGLFRGTNPAAIFSLIAVIVSMTMVDMFDTLGFLIGTSSKAGLIDENGKIDGMNRVMLADAGATMIGSLCGASTVTVYAESASGITAGGRTGLTSVTTAICFLLALFFSPIAGMMNSSITSPALIIVGMLLMMDIKKMQFETMDDAFPALLTLAAIPLAYSITTGIAVGFISHVICKIAAGKKADLSKSSVILALIFVIYFFL